MKVWKMDDPCLHVHVVLCPLAARSSSSAIRRRAIEVMGMRASIHAAVCLDDFWLLSQTYHMASILELATHPNDPQN